MNKRKLLDINNLKLNLDENDISIKKNVIRLKLYGPEDSIYSNGKWIIRIEITAEYPYKSPSVGFETKIFHPNIDFKSGSICLNVLNQTWSPIYNLSHIYETFLPQLLLYPNADDPLNSEAANLFKYDIEEFKKITNEKIKLYCDLIDL